MIAASLEVAICLALAVTALWYAHADLPGAGVTAILAAAMVVFRKPREAPR